MEKGERELYFFFPHGVTLNRADQNTDESVAICRAGAVPQEGCAGQHWVPLGMAQPARDSCPQPCQGSGIQQSIKSWAGSVTAALLVVQSRDQTSCWFITFI